MIFIRSRFAKLIFANMLFAGALIADGETPAAKIVLPSIPTRVEQFAAEELSRCLAAAGAIKTEVITNALPSQAAGVVFWVANLTENDILAKSGFPLQKVVADKLVEDGVCVSSDGRQVILLGKGPRGALNAVYTFLEKVLGLHWPEPGKEFVPRLKKWKPPVVNFSVNPRFRYRGLSFAEDSAERYIQVMDWMAKNRMNTFQTSPDNYEKVRPAMLDALLERGLELHIGHHCRGFFLPTEKYRADHLDWFAINAGKTTAQLCYSNLESVPVYAANVVAYLKTRPEVTMVCLWPFDGLGFCECARCKSKTDTDVILNYINETARAIHAEMPDMKVEYLAYLSYTDAPREVKPLPYVVPLFCEMYAYCGARSLFHPITNDSYAPKTKELRAELEKYISISKEVTLYSYYGDNCLKKFLYCPITDVVVADLNYFAKIGLAGNFVLAGFGSWWADAPHLYADAQAAWDGSLNAGQIDCQYYESLYGVTAPVMLSHAKACRTMLDMETAYAEPKNKPLTFLRMFCRPDLLTPSYIQFDAGKDRETRRRFDAAMLEVEKYLAQAKPNVPDDFAATRITKLEADARMIRLYFQAICDMHQYRAKPTPGAKDRLVELLIQFQRQCADLNDFGLVSNFGSSLGGELLGFKSILPVVKMREILRDRVGQWTSADVAGSTKQNPRRLAIEVTDRIKTNGNYEVIWRYDTGGDGLLVIRAGLYCSKSKEDVPGDLQLIADNEQGGFAAARDLIQQLNLLEYKADCRYFLVSQIYCAGGQNSCGHILFKPASKGADH